MEILLWKNYTSKKNDHETGFPHHAQEGIFPTQNLLFLLIL